MELPPGIRLGTVEGLIGTWTIPEPSSRRPERWAKACRWDRITDTELDCIFNDGAYTQGGKLRDSSTWAGPVEFEAGWHQRYQEGGPEAKEQLAAVNHKYNISL